MALAQCSRHTRHARCRARTAARRRWTRPWRPKTTCSGCVTTSARQAGGDVAGPSLSLFWLRDDERKASGRRRRGRAAILAAEKMKLNFRFPALGRPAQAPEVLAHIAAENAHTEAALAHLKPFQARRLCLLLFLNGFFANASAVREKDVPNNQLPRCRQDALYAELKSHLKETDEKVACELFLSACPIKCRRCCCDELSN